MATVYGDTAHLLQDPAEYRLEEFLLHHHLEIDAVVPIIGQPDKEILNGGVWRHEADGAAQVGRGLVDGRTTAEFKADFSYEFFDFSHDKQCSRDEIILASLQY